MYAKKSQPMRKLEVERGRGGVGRQAKMLVVATCSYLPSVATFPFLFLLQAIRIKVVCFNGTYREQRGNLWFSSFLLKLWSILLPCKRKTRGDGGCISALLG